MKKWKGGSKKIVPLKYLSVGNLSTFWIIYTTDNIIILVWHFNGHGMNKLNNILKFSTEFNWYMIRVFFSKIDKTFFSFFVVTQ